MIVNARMYSVAPAAKAAWRELLEWVLEQANLRMEFVDQESPATLADLWVRNDVGPLDSYVHDLIRHNDPAFAANVRVIAVTEAAPMPPIIATAALDPDAVGRLRKAFLAVGGASELRSVRETLLLRRFAVPEPSAYDVFHGILKASEQHAGVW